MVESCGLRVYLWSMLRVIFCEPYQIFYRILADQHCVEILHVRHAVRQPYHP